MSRLSKTVAVLQVEDHPIVRAGMQPYVNDIAENVTIVVAETLASAIDALQGEVEFDLILIDLNLPDGNGLDVLYNLKQNNRPIPVVVLSASNNLDDMDRALTQGAKGFITKDIDPEIMVHALRLVLAGGLYVPEQLINYRLNDQWSVTEKSSRPNDRALTDRQQEVLKCLIDGHSNKEIARQINCAESTVKAHVTAVLKTLGVPNRNKAAQAAKYWYEKQEKLTQ